MISLFTIMILYKFILLNDKYIIMYDIFISMNTFIIIPNTIIGFKYSKYIITSMHISIKNTSSVSG